ncbi:MAG: inorganic triphosphatase [Comamonadaceae bacterium]|nr:inorganic triphosphatase [Comamonadaceae bacterium]
MAQETELKLLLQAPDLPRLLAHPLLAASKPRREHLRNTYFDTPELALMAQRIAVRERRVGRRTLLTVKTAGTSVGGLSRRGEWEGPTLPGRMDFAALVDDPDLATRLGALQGQLVPVFRTDFTRRSWLIGHGSAQIELALDQGAISTGHAPQAPQDARSEAILELELELQSGPVDALFALALTLARGPGGELWLQPSDRSKAERGLALFQGRPVGPQKAQAAVLRPGMRPLEAFRATAQEGLVQLQANLVGLLQPSAPGVLPDPEYVHQARVALRRLRTGLGLFREHLPEPFAAHWAAQWKTSSAALDAARNWDVLDERLLQWLTDRATRSLAPDALAPLAQWVLEQRLAANRQAALHLRQPAQALQLLAFAQALLALPARADKADRKGLADWAADTLRQRQRRLLKQARHAHLLDLEGLHAMRIRLKKLRYAEGFLQNLLPSGKALNAPVLERAQDTLGELNDLATTQRLMRACDVPGTEPWHRFLLQRQANMLRELPQLQRALSEMPPP